MRCKWHGKYIMVHCDNQSVVTVINSGRTRDPISGDMLRNIAMLTATNDIRLRTVHIPGKENVIAENLSRLAIHPQHSINLQHLIPYHSWV